MAGNSVVLSTSDDSLKDVLEAAFGKLNGPDGELVLDFSSVRRIDSGAIRAMEELAAKAEQKNVTITLRGVKVDVYKVLKLARLTELLSFAQ